MKGWRLNVNLVDNEKCLLDVPLLCLYKTLTIESFLVPLNILY